MRLKRLGVVVVCRICGFNTTTVITDQELLTHQQALSLLAGAIEALRKPGQDKLELQHLHIRARMSPAPNERFKRLFSVFHYSHLEHCTMLPNCKKGMSKSLKKSIPLKRKRTRKRVFYICSVRILHSQSIIRTWRKEEIESKIGQTHVNESKERHG